MIYIIVLQIYAIYTLLLSSVEFVFSSEKIQKIVYRLSFIPVISLFLAIIINTIIIKDFPIVNIFGVILLLTLSVSITNLIIFNVKILNKNVFKFIFIFSTLLLSTGFLPQIYNVPDGVTDQLKSPFLMVHVSLAVIGESMFFLGFIFSIISLIKFKRYHDKSDFKKVFLFNCIGYFIFSIGAIVMGSLWAKDSWGRYWGWDPKEIFSLITIVMYTIYFISWYVLREKQKMQLIISIAAFLCTVFTIFGVSFLMVGLHSYSK